MWELNGIIPVYKPVGPTSHDVIDQLRRLTGEQRIGHAGTLDPLASGVLIVGIGREATRQLQQYVKQEKVYRAEITLGMESTTDDAAGEKADCPVEVAPERKRIEEALQRFEGTIEQLPPIYSAIKVRGKPAHRRVRKGEQIQLKPRTVVIKKIELLQYQWPLLEIRVTCGSGVYIRSLARDIGRALGTGGYISELVRERVGSFGIEDAVRL